MNFGLDIAYSEEQFLDACIRGEMWALKLVYEEYFNEMIPICRRYANTEEDAMDILHDGFIKVFNNFDKYKAGTSMAAWIKRIMINTSIDYYRKESRRRSSDIDTALGVCNPDADVLAEMAAEEIIKALQQLPQVYRSVFNLYVVEGYSHKDVAETLNISESTSRSNLVKARLKLKSILAKLNIER
jgi:RNA polymerase sigma factor (sigma-70 family)